MWTIYASTGHEGDEFAKQKLGFSSFISCMICIYLSISIDHLYITFLNFMCVLETVLEIWVESAR